MPAYYQSRGKNLMTGPIQLTRRVALCGVFLWMLQGSVAVLAGPCSAYPCRSGCICIANAQDYGYFHARWRRWPGELRPDIDFPRSIGAEVLPTPEGEKQSEGGLRPKTDSPFLPEPPIEAPGQFPTGAPFEPGIEIPAEPKVEVPAEPPTKKPSEPPIKPSAEPPADAPPKAPDEVPKDTALLKPSLQNNRATPAKERRGVPPLFGPDRVGGLPGRLPAEPLARRVFPGPPVDRAPAGAPRDTALLKPRPRDGWVAPAEQSRAMPPLVRPGWFGGLPGRQPDAGRSAPLGVPAENAKLEIPDVRAELPKLAPRSPLGGKANKQELDISAEAPKDTATFRPLLQSSWASLAEERRGMAPLLGPSWLGPLPTRSAGRRDAPSMGGPPDAGRSVPLGMPAEKPKLEIPNSGVEFPRLAPRSLIGENLYRGRLDISRASDRRPSAERSRPESLRANWTAALDPGFRGEISRATGRYPSVERPQPATYQVAVEPQVHSQGHVPRPTDGMPAVREHPPEQPREQPSGRSPDVEQVRSMPPALEGFCPVELGESERWLPGNPRWSAVYQGRTYLFSGPTQRQHFLAAPHRYAAAYSAHDPVLVVDGNRRVPGHTDYCVIYDGRLYMFSSSATLARFKENPQRYTVGGRR